MGARGRAPAESGAEPLGPQARGGGASGSYRIAKMQRERRGTCDGSEWPPWPGPWPWRERLRPAATVGGRFRQPDRKLLPAHSGLHPLRKNGFVLSGDDGTGPTTGDRPRRSTPVRRATAYRERRIGDCKIGAGQGHSAYASARVVRIRAERKAMLHVKAEGEKGKNG